MTSKPPSLKPLLASGPIGTPAGFAERSRTKTASNAVLITAEPLVEGCKTQFRSILSDIGDSSLAERMAGCRVAATEEVLIVRDPERVLVILLPSQPEARGHRSSCTAQYQEQFRSVLGICSACRRQTAEERVLDTASRRASQM